MFSIVFIIDGSGYVKDEREIFDDDLDNDSIISAVSHSKKDRTGSKRGRDGRKETNQMSAGSGGWSSNIILIYNSFPTWRVFENKSSGM